MDLGKMVSWPVVVVGLLMSLCGQARMLAGDRSAFVQAGAENKPHEASAATPDTEVPEADKLKGPNVFVPADRTVLRLLDRARLLLEQERYAESVRCLGAILDSPEDYFFQPDQNGPVHLSLKAEAQRLLGQMPRTGSELYELQYGARARQMLKEAAAAGDPTLLTDVSRRFYHTQAGYEATLLLGLNHMDHGRWLAAALVLQRLRDTSPTADQFEPTLSLAIATSWLRSGNPARAQEALVALKTRQPNGKVVVAGKEVPLFNQPAQALTWLTSLIGPSPQLDVTKTDDWAMFRGNAARNAASLASGPLLSLRWRVPMTDHPYVEALIKELQEADQDRDEWTVPSLHPLVVDNVVLMRTAQTLLAVDFTTGKRIWEVPVDDPFEPLVDPEPETSFSRGPQLEQGLRLRLWGDATYGTLSSDGRLVFAIEDLRLENNNPYMSSMFFRGPRSGEEQGPKSYNRLAAYDIHTGKLKWHLGGSPEEFGLPLAGTFFLGPPLPLMDQLFVIAEMKGEIRLIALEAQSGNQLWSQQLADVDRDILNDLLRRLSGVSPSYADGILVCPTSNQSVVALELASRSLLWGYTYAPQSDANQQAMFFATHGMIDPNPAGRWTDSSIIITGGRVLTTPIESNEIHCLNLVDGKLLWKQARQEDLYLACEHQGQVILVGKQRVRALNLANGQATWSIDFPTGSRPSGTGFLSGDIYHIPLSSAAVMAVDVKTGRLESIAKSRRGSVPGNLVCYEGKVVSQRADAVELFYQLEALKNLVDQRLAQSARDASALRLRGEILWHQGHLDEAIAAFQQSLAVQADPSTRDLLRDAYFNSLETDFAGHRQQVAEIERLIDSPGQQAQFLRLMALGYEKTGDYRSALAQYQKLIELGHGHRDLDTVDAVLSVRRDRWIQGRLAALRDHGSQPMREAVDELALAQWQAAKREGSASSLQRFLDYFGSHPLADEARPLLVRKLQASGRMLEAEFLLLRGQRASDPHQAAAALSQLAELFRQADRYRDAAICYARLCEQFSDVPCSEGKTGAQLVASLPADNPIRRYLQPPTWPTARVDVTRTGVQTSPASRRLPSTVEHIGRRSPFFDDVAIEMQPQPALLIARDGLGNPLWEMAMSDTIGQDEFSFSRGLMRLATEGHLLLVSIGNKLLALDTLAPSANNSPRLLWKQDFNGVRSDLAARAQPIGVRVGNVAGRLQRIHVSSNADMPINLPEAVSEQLVCLRQHHRCTAIDPTSGEVLWQRLDIRPDSIIFGDAEYLFVVPSGETKATVLRALDGELLGQRELPAPVEPQNTFGRRVLVWHDQGDEGTLEMVDAWSGERAWPAKKFPSGAQMQQVQNEAVALFEPGGRFMLVNLTDGRTVIDTRLQPEPPLCEMFVLRSAQQYLVITQGPENDQNDNRHTHSVTGTASPRITKAHIYAFDRQGKNMWPAPVMVEDQYLPLDQPGQLPVLIFAAMVQERKQEQRALITNTVILGLDKRNGHIICSEAIPNSTTGLTLIGNPQKQTVDIRLQRETITLSFADHAATPSQAIWKAIRRAVLSPNDPSARSMTKQPGKQVGEGRND